MEKSRNVNRGLAGVLAGTLTGAAALMQGCGATMQYAATQHPDPRMQIAGAIFGSAVHDFEVAEAGRDNVQVYINGQESTPKDGNYDITKDPNYIRVWDNNIQGYRYMKKPKGFDK